MNGRLRAGSLAQFVKYLLRSLVHGCRSSVYEGTDGETAADVPVFWEPHGAPDLTR